MRNKRELPIRGPQFAGLSLKRISGKKLLTAVDLPLRLDVVGFLKVGGQAKLSRVTASLCRGKN